VEELASTKHLGERSNLQVIILKEIGGGERTFLFGAGTLSITNWLSEKNGQIFFNSLQKKLIMLSENV
jgi:hypothetical protein